MEMSIKDLVEIGKIAKDIRNKMEYADELQKKAYDLLSELNSKMSDLNGQVLEMEDILKLDD